MKKALYELSDSALAPINARVTEFQKTFHAHMKAHGYERDACVQSAQYHWDYVKGKHKISICGWHGTGKRGTSRFYGAAKSLNSLYDSNNVSAYKSVIETNHDAESYEKLIADLDKAMADALAYIRRVVK